MLVHTIINGKFHTVEVKFEQLAISPDNKVLALDSTGQLWLITQRGTLNNSLRATKLNIYDY